MSRTLTWFLEKPHRVENSVGQAYRIDQPYDIAFAWAYSETAPTKQSARVDILADGVSIFSTKLALSRGETSTDQYTLSTKELREGQYVTLNFLQGDASVGNLSIGLELT